MNDWAQYPSPKPFCFDKRTSNRNEAGKRKLTATFSRNRFVWANKKAPAKFIIPVCVIQSYEWLGAIPFAKAFLFWQTDAKSKWSRTMLKWSRTMLKWSRTMLKWSHHFTKSIRVSKQKGSSEVYYTSMCHSIIWMIGCNTLRQSLFVLTNGRQIEMKPASFRVCPKSRTEFVIPVMVNSSMLYNLAHESCAMHCRYV